MMDIGTWPDWVRSLVFGASMIVATIAGLRTARRFRDVPAPARRSRALPAHWQPSAPTVVVDEPDGPAGSDTTTTAGEGLRARKGWAGHS
ncbi:hypothetical protein ACQEVI_27845 [Promicromonospora sp. CA-289599]|uniref:hypothetical protein n=1 Tax=Promicromonospora sp. CA-289599 TaxID=3240014 RepID=UPI003D8B5FD2